MEKIPSTCAHWLSIFNLTEEQRSIASAAASRGKPRKAALRKCEILIFCLIGQTNTSWNNIARGECECGESTTCGVHIHEAVVCLFKWMSCALVNDLGPPCVSFYLKRRWNSALNTHTHTGYLYCNYINSRGQFKPEGVCKTFWELSSSSVQWEMVKCVHHTVSYRCTVLASTASKRKIMCCVLGFFALKVFYSINLYYYRLLSMFQYLCSIQGSHSALLLSKVGTRYCFLEQ